ncbi:MAG: hypothetical protein J7M26_06575, partial [Armatimonadetes bacterium]|nr:hypothetical protein [Armatimonadota bacterium]
MTVLVAVLMSLATTADPVFNQRTQDFYADSPDSVNIADWAGRSTLRDALSWWYGPWIQRTGYYRPLSSWIIWIEYLLAGRSFQAFCAVSWLLHGLNGALLALFALALFRHRPWPWAWALVAVALFNYRLGPAGPSWQPWPVSIGVVAWWPAQTDQLSLAAGLCALLLLDRYARLGSRADAVAASVLCLASLLSKEMAVALPLLGAALLAYRRALQAWRVPTVWAGMSVALLVVRALAVPNAAGPSLSHFWPPYMARKLVWYSFERLYS